MFLYTDGDIFGLTFRDLCRRYPNTSFPQGVELENSYRTVPPPEYNTRTHALREVCPSSGVQQWEVYERDPAEVMAQDQAEVAGKIESLWIAADAYVSGYISGAAVGILTIGTIQQKPKCLAVSAWSNAVWADYYARKAAVQPGVDIDTDYSSHGPIPYTVPELQSEVGM